MPKLQSILDWYHDYVNDCLMFDDSPEEIMPFGYYAELHYGVNQEEAHAFMFAQAA